MGAHAGGSGKSGGTRKVGGRGAGNPSSKPINAGAGISRLPGAAANGTKFGEGQKRGGTGYSKNGRSAGPSAPGGGTLGSRPSFKPLGSSGNKSNFNARKK